MSEEEFYFFYRSASPFSQFHPATFTVNGVKYNWAEQYMMHHKALLFNDSEIAEEILKAGKPANCKKLGRKVKGFNDSVWRDNRERIVAEGSYHKFTQNEGLKEALLSTGSKTLVEASPGDTIWGIGLSERDERAQSRETWRGTNLLGEILTRTREKIKREARGD